MDAYAKAQGIRRRLGARRFLRRAAKYAVATAALVGFAYLADHCNASKTIDDYVGKAKQGIESVIE